MSSSNGESDRGAARAAATFCISRRKTARSLPFEVVGILEDADDGSRRTPCSCTSRTTKTTANSSSPISTAISSRTTELAQEILDDFLALREEAGDDDEGEALIRVLFLSASVGVGHLSAANAVGAALRRDRSERADAGRRLLQVRRAGRFARRFRRLSADGQDHSADVPVTSTTAPSARPKSGRFAPGRISLPRAILRPLHVARTPRRRRLHARVSVRRDGRIQAAVRRRAAGRRDRDGFRGARLLDAR